MSETDQVVVKVRWDFKARQQEELDIRKNENLILLDDSRSWWQVKKPSGEVGFVPSNYVKRVKTPLGSMSTGDVHVSRSISIIGTKQKNLSAGDVPRPVSSLNKRERIHIGGDEDDDTFNLRIAVTAKFHYRARQEDELSIRKGDKIIVQKKSNEGWWKGESNGRSGWFPSNYVTEGPVQVSTNFRANFIHTVVTLYSFQGRNDEELDFERGQKLDVAEPENDPEWWIARNKDGETGLVPKNYVQVLDNTEWIVRVSKANCSVINV